MNKILVATLSLVLSSALFAGMGEQKQEQKQMGKQMMMYQSVSPEQAQIIQTGDEKGYCPACAMDLVKYYKTNMAVKLEDGSARQYCSIHCLVEEMEYSFLKDKKDKVKEILVTDNETLKLVDAKSAFFVVGSDKPGTMTMTSNYAFAKKEAAESFAKTSGGEVMTYEGAYKVAQTAFSKDINMIQNMRSSKMYPIGEKIYSEQCDKEKLDSLHTHSIGSLKAIIQNTKMCGELNDMQAQAISLYVWDKKLEKLESLKKEVK